MRHVILLFVATLMLSSDIASAETGLDFMRLDTYDRTKILEPYILDYVAEGYRNVPDQFDLSIEVANSIRKDGSGRIDLKLIAIETAKRMGMSK